MPKLKPSPIRAQAETVHRNIVSRGALFGLHTDKDFGKKLGMAPSTFCAHRAEPRLWTIEQIAMAAIALKCTVQWLVTDHTGQIGDDT